MICCLMAIITSFFCVIFKGKISSNLLIFSLQITLDMVVLFSASIKWAGEMHNYMISTQKIFDYTQLESEDETYKKTDEQLIVTNKTEKGAWPYEGMIKFDNVSMKYREYLQPAINGLSFVVQPGMKVGVVGRTGAGKSSIIQTLFRLSES